MRSLRFAALCGVVLGLPAWAQEDAGAVAAAPVEAPLAAADGGTPTAAVLPLVGDAGSITDAALTGDGGSPVVAAAKPDGGLFSGSVGAQVRLSFATGNPFLLDDTGTVANPMPVETRVRVAGQVRLKRFGLQVELDALTGAVAGVPDGALVAARVPVPSAVAAELRELYLEYRWATGVARLGQQVSHFGLGVLSNAGKADGDSGDFGQQHFGSLALRALVVSRPLFGWGGAWRAFEPAVAFDLVVRDSTANLYEGDLAFQGIVSLRFHVDEQRLLSLTAIYRHQSPLQNAQQERTDAWVIDLGAQWRFFDALNVGVEAVTVLGTTTQTRSVDFPLLRLRQYGAAAKLKWTHAKVTVLFDAGLASGDDNPYDGQLTAFRFDRDFKAGLVLFDVLGWQSARTALRAADPGLSGVPPEGVHLLPTGGAVTGAAYLFPRVSGAVLEWLDVYGGPMWAFTTAPLTDAFLTRTSTGGVPVNSLGGKGQGLLGTEVDVGVTAHTVLGNFAVRATVEGGVLVPGAALAKADGSSMGLVWMGRLRLGASGL